MSDRSCWAALEASHQAIKASADLLKATEPLVKPSALLSARKAEPRERRSRKRSSSPGSNKQEA